MILKARPQSSILALGLLLVAGLLGVPLSQSTGVASLSAAPQKGRLHATKECSDYHGAAGEFCTFTGSNLAQIKVDSTVTYDQAAGIPTGLLDSNVILDAGNGDRAIGRCTLDLTTYLGLCTFSDGTGQFAGFNARVDVSFDGALFHWDGTYNFDHGPK